MGLHRETALIPEGKRCEIVDPLRKHSTNPRGRDCVVQVCVKERERNRERELSSRSLLHMPPALAADRLSQTGSENPIQLSYMSDNDPVGQGITTESQGLL